MARRRLAGLLDLYMRHYLESKRQQEQAELVKQRQIELAKQQDDSEILKQILGDPTGRIVDSLVRSGRTQWGSLAPTLGQRTVGVREDINKASNLSELPTEESTFGGIRATTEGDLSSSRNFPTLMQLMNERRTKEEALKKQRPTKQITQYDPTLRTETSRFVPEDEVSALPPFQTKPTPREEGENVGIKTQAETPFVVAEGNKREAGLRGERVRTAGATARSSAYGQQAGYLAPEHIRSRVEEDRLKKQNEARSAQHATEGERRAATNLVPLMEAHAQAKSLENQGAAIVTGSQMVSGSPFLSSINAQLPEGLAVGTDPLNYTQVAKNFASTYTYIKSGVQSRQDEYDRYISTLFHFSGDPPEVKKMKTKTREVFINASMIAADRSKFDGGVALGRAVKTGTVPADFLSLLDMDPEFKRGVDVGLGLIGAGPMR